MLLFKKKKTKNEYAKCPIKMIKNNKFKREKI